MYDGIPQLKQKNSTVEIYFTNEEVRLTFDSKFTVLKFINAANTLLTGKSMSERGAAKFKGAVELVDDALGIKTIDTMKGVLENGVVGTVFSGIGKMGKVPVKANSVANTIAEAVGITKSFIGDKEAVETAEKREEPQGISLIEQIEALKKLKDLVDAGILTQEEFDAKKKQIMGL